MYFRILTYNDIIIKKKKKLGKRGFKAPNKLSTKYPDLANLYGIHVVKHTILSLHVYFTSSPSPVLLAYAFDLFP